MIGLFELAKCPYNSCYFLFAFCVFVEVVEKNDEKNDDEIKTKGLS